jgi:hypothetical protein
MIDDRVMKEIIVGSVAVASAALFSGIPAAVLVWWTWQRDQERLLVQKLLWYGNKLGGGEVLLSDTYGPMFHILIRNRSLFSVYVSAVGFEIDGVVLQMGHPYFDAKLRRNPDPTSFRTNVIDDSFDVREIRGGNSLSVSIHDPKDRAALTAALNDACKKYGTPARCEWQ